ncbi:FMN-binding negative transcriptional regulator [Arenibaculum pallidiluteum]|uniref:FMN-binding negative transcriptional regulator n=1 Tax=Arenibaculum pallidiluteum TaxID=2812559 RepID=UPI001A972150|nr:FMN-binding negative transcriptional regulator [Arenibaculum pallidiluteum]
MYVPAAFRIEDLPELHAVIAQTGLATVVSGGAEGLVASHVPLLLDPAAGPLGTLYGHLARANPQARSIAAGEALAIFGGPDGYVTPSWYATKWETGRVVPTWNYVAVHAYGPVQVFEEPERLRAVVEALTERHEAGREEPWRVSDAPEDFLRGQLKGIVGIAIPIVRIEGKRKLGQNRPRADREGVVAGLGASAREGDRRTAALMAEDLGPGA